MHERHQGEHPRGVLGRIFGFFMGRGNAAQNRLTVEQLRIQPGDAVLEIGFGPGHALEQIAATTRAGLIAGADHSALMVRTAARRNRRAVQAGRMQLHEADADALPFPDATFDLAFAVNSYQQWDDPMAALREIGRTLEPGGRVVLSVRIVQRDRRWESAAQGRAYTARAPRDLAAAGFADVGVREHDLGDRSVVLVSGMVATTSSRIASTARARFTPGSPRDSGA